MAVQADYKQINAPQWNSLTPRMRELLRVFDASAAAKIDFKLAQAMDANAVFKEYLANQLGPDPDTPFKDSIFISPKNQTAQIQGHVLPFAHVRQALPRHDFSRTGAPCRLLQKS